MKPALFRPAAAADIEDAFAWYERQRVGLGHEYLIAVQAALELMVANPGLYPVVHRDTRRALVRRFPFSVFYRLHDEWSRASMRSAARASGRK